MYKFEDEVGTTTFIPSSLFPLVKLKTGTYVVYNIHVYFTKYKGQETSL